MRFIIVNIIIKSPLNREIKYPQDKEEAWKVLSNILESDCQDWNLFLPHWKYHAPSITLCT